MLDHGGNPARLFADMVKRRMKLLGVVSWPGGWLPSPAVNPLLAARYPLVAAVEELLLEAFSWVTVSARLPAAAPLLPAACPLPPATSLLLPAASPPLPMLPAGSPPLVGASRSLPASFTALPTASPSLSIESLPLPLASPTLPVSARAALARSSMLAVWSRLLPAGALPPAAPLPSPAASGAGPPWR